MLFLLCHVHQGSSKHSSQLAIYHFLLTGIFSDDWIKAVSSVHVNSRSESSMKEWLCSITVWHMVILVSLLHMKKKQAKKMQPLSSPGYDLIPIGQGIQPQFLTRLLVRIPFRAKCLFAICRLCWRLKPHVLACWKTQSSSHPGLGYFPPSRGTVPIGTETLISPRYSESIPLS